MPNDIFNPNSAQFTNAVDEKTKLDILKTFVSSTTNVKIYMENKILESVTHPTNDMNKIAIVFSNSNADQVFKSGKELTCHFSLHNDLYFFKAVPTFTDTLMVFSKLQTLYKIQRRDNFRVVIPRNMTQKVEVVGHPDLKIVMVDLSLGGCKIDLTYLEPKQIEKLKAGSEIALQMTFLDFEEQRVYCKVKFIKDFAKTKTASIGLEFEKLTAEETQTMQSNIFKIERLYRRAMD